MKNRGPRGRGKFLQVQLGVLHVRVPTCVNPKPEKVDVVVDRRPVGSCQNGPLIEDRSTTSRNVAEGLPLHFSKLPYKLVQTSTTNRPDCFLIEKNTRRGSG